MNTIQVELIALSNYADISRDGKLSISGIFDEIYANQLPGQFLRGFLVFTISQAKPSSTIPIKVSIKDAQGKEIIKQEAAVLVGTRGKGHFIAELVGLPLPTAGQYTISLFHQKILLEETNFFVTQAKGITHQKKGSLSN